MAREPDPRNDLAGRYRRLKRCRDFMDEHPRIGWYIAAISSLNAILNLLDLLHH